LVDRTVDEQLVELVQTADASLLIAPECGGILAHHCRLVEACGGRLLGPSSAAVECTADKQVTADLLSSAGIPTPPTLPLAGDNCKHLPGWPFPLVCKPRDGAGSQATFRVDTVDQYRQALQLARAEGWQGQMVLQPFLPGMAASIVCLVGGEQSAFFPAAEQKLSTDGRFHYLGGRLPLSPQLSQRARALAARAVAAIPGLRGLIGIDLGLGAAPDGSGDAVIEINPRLTTSYVGLRRLARFNIAEAILAVGLNRPLPAIAWAVGEVHFRADGSIIE
jgi:predicted ATP-grasp superfamily ATP-dependent carboligase